MSPRPASDPTAVDVRDSLVQTSFTVIALLSRAAAEHDLSLTQLRVLAILHDHEPTVTQLAAHLGLERSSVSGLVDRADKRGLVRRNASDQDGRSVRLGLTPEGRHITDQLGQVIGDLLAPMTQALRPSERRHLVTLLDKLLAGHRSQTQAR